MYPVLTTLTFTLGEAKNNWKVLPKEVIQLDLLVSALVFRLKVHTGSTALA